MNLRKVDVNEVFSNITIKQLVNIALSPKKTMHPDIIKVLKKIKKHKKVLKQHNFIITSCKCSADTKLNSVIFSFYTSERKTIFLVDGHIFENSREIRLYLSSLSSDLQTKYIKHFTNLDIWL